MIEKKSFSLVVAPDPLHYASPPLMVWDSTGGNVEASTPVA